MVQLTVRQLNFFDVRVDGVARLEEDRFEEVSIAWEMPGHMKTIAVERTIETERLRVGGICIDGISERGRSPATVYILVNSLVHTIIAVLHTRAVLYLGM